jgi:arsenate reductase
MAEGFLNAHYADSYEGYSAGTEPVKINKHAIDVMQEVGIDISNHQAKSIERFRGMHFDYVITVCNHAKEVCPFFPGDKILHKSFNDPSSAKGTRDEKLKYTRNVRDEIGNWIRKTFGKNEWNK